MKFNEYYLEVFMNWLVDNHLVVDYIEEFLRHKKTLFPHVRNLCNHDYHRIIELSFQWKETKRGEKFWEDKNKEWKEYAEKYRITPQKGTFLFCRSIDGEVILIYRDEQTVSAVLYLEDGKAKSFVHNAIHDLDKYYYIRKTTKEESALMYSVIWEKNCAMIDNDVFQF